MRDGCPRRVVGRYLDRHDTECRMHDRMAWCDRCGDGMPEFEPKIHRSGEGATGDGGDTGPARGWMCVVLGVMEWRRHGGVRASHVDVPEENREGADNR